MAGKKKVNPFQKKPGAKPDETPTKGKPAPAKGKMPMKKGC